MNDIFRENNAIKRSAKNLRDYQKNVIEYMTKHHRLLVFHKMGTGKTLTAVTVSQSYLDRYPNHKVIVISPATLIDNFKKEMFLSYKNIKHKNRYEFYSIQKATNLMKEGVLNCSDSLVIIDEVHNYRTLIKWKKGILKTGKNVFYMKPCINIAHKVLLLTGTPVYNSPKDLNNLKDFLKTDDLRCMISYHDYEKDDSNFPQRIDIPVFIPMSSEYEEEYNKIMDEIYSDNEMQMILSMRYFNNDNPNSLRKFATAIRRATQNLDSTLENNKKLEFLNNLIHKIYRKNKRRTRENRFKLIIYSGYKNHGINLVKQIMPNDKKYLPYATISGDTKMSDRQKKVRLYNQGKINVLFLTKAAGEGLDLKGTDAIIIMEPNWNENSIEQVIARAIRFQSHKDRQPKRKVVRVIQLYHVKEYDRSKEYLDDLKKETDELEKSDKYDGYKFHIHGDGSCDEIMRSFSIKKQIILNKIENDLKNLSIENNDCSTFKSSDDLEIETSSTSSLVPLTVLPPKKSGDKKVVKKGDKSKRIFGRSKEDDNIIEEEERKPKKINKKSSPDYKKYEVRVLLKECRKRKIPLITRKINNKDYLIQKLIENDRKKLSNKNLKEKSVRELMIMCRERGIPLTNLDKIHNKDYLIRKLTEKKKDKKVDSIKKDKEPHVSSSSDLKNKTIRELISMCRERNIPLKSYKKSFLIQKLENYNKPKTSSSTSVKEKEIISSSTSSSKKENKYKESKYYQKTVRELISLCRERKIPLKSYKKDFLVQKLEKDDKK